MANLCGFCYSEVGFVGCGLAELGFSRVTV